MKGIAADLPCSTLPALLCPALTSTIRYEGRFDGQLIIQLYHEFSAVPAIKSATLPLRPAPTLPSHLRSPTATC
ncbi:hypothetical protein E2C01_076072 [Portunus trituberculatus]|uniref:Uncharacterized protein n=1 Tax=Portunus trituberculatus TaxID=210409 RepID=A0A5B7IGW4_PORTR|nr:hypothetical protein [Portunus trituberculatus]